MGLVPHFTFDYFRELVFHPRNVILKVVQLMETVPLVLESVAHSSKSK